MRPSDHQSFCGCLDTHTHIHRNLQHSFVLGNLSISRKLRKKAKYSSESLLFFEYPWAFWMHLFEIIYDEDQRWNCTSNQTHRAVHIVHSRSDCCKKIFFIYLLLWAQSLKILIWSRTNSNPLWFLSMPRQSRKSWKVSVVWELGARCPTSHWFS